MKNTTLEYHTFRFNYMSKTFEYKLQALFMIIIKSKIISCLSTTMDKNEPHFCQITNCTMKRYTLVSCFKTKLICIGSWPLLSASQCFWREAESRCLNGSEPFNPNFYSLWKAKRGTKQRFKWLWNGLSICFLLPATFTGNRKQGFPWKKWWGEESRGLNYSGPF